MLNFTLSHDVLALAYLIATILFIFGLKGLSHPRLALAGNRSAIAGMCLAVIVTMISPEVAQYSTIIWGLLGGAVIGSIVALRINMKSMPELVAILHSFVGLAAVLVALGTFLGPHSGVALSPVLSIELGLGSIIGAITFSGSLIAFGKLSGKLSSNPLVFPGRHFLNLLLVVVAVVLLVLFVQHGEFWPLLAMTILALILGLLLVMPIGGGDMPVVVSMLNSYSGWAASATGFSLNNYLLIATGALVGSSGAILSYIMCKAMNRGFLSVILGGFGGETAAATSAAAKGNRNVKAAAADDVAYLLENASKVVIVPGYGMAVAQAQHAVKELFEKLRAKGVEVKFAIHPVAGRMPGHMNVLLAEADVPYEHVVEMDEINSEFAATDVVLVIGANDIVNPAAKTDKSSPLYGMPILEVHKARQVIVLKRSLGAGYAGVDNELFFYDHCSLLFSDAKAGCEALIKALV